MTGKTFTSSSFRNISLIAILLLSLVIPGLDIFSIDTIATLDITGTYINPAQYQDLILFGPLPQEVKDSLFTPDVIDKKITENIQLIANYMLTGFSFVHYRSQKAKGFQAVTDYQQPVVAYALQQMSFRETSGFSYQMTARIAITESIRKRIHRYIDSTGVIEKGEGAVAPFSEPTSIPDIVNEAVKRAVDSLVENAVVRQYGRNYLFKIRGECILIEQPMIRVTGSVIYAMVKGYILFTGFVQ